jgi:uncharacterized damage-inducible protein DinB
MSASPEPWLRGPIAGVAPHLLPVFHSFQQVREDLRTHTAGVADADVWRAVEPLPPLGFQLRHIAGSVDRLTTYLLGEQVSPEQIAVLKAESTPGVGLTELLDGVDAALAASEARMATMEASTLFEPRYIGRKQLPSSVLGLLVHLAEHTQRHLGQAITTAKLLRAA